MLNKIIHGGCLEIMKDIPDNSIDMICCDLPYGVTKNKWDSVIDLTELWKAYKRIIKDNGAITLFGQDKFTARVMLSNEQWHRYNIIWEKTTPTGFLNAKKMPLRSHEDIMVFYKHLPNYTPQMTSGYKPVNSYVKHTSDGTNYGKTKIGISGGGSTERYPKSIWTFPTDKQKLSLHPTQKPVALIEKLVLSYTTKDMVVLDNCIGSGTTAEVCIINGRNFIGIDNDAEMVSIANNRIKNIRIGLF